MKNPKSHFFFYLIIFLMPFADISAQEPSEEEEYTELCDGCFPVSYSGPNLSDRTNLDREDLTFSKIVTGSSSACGDGFNGTPEIEFTIDYSVFLSATNCNNIDLSDSCNERTCDWSMSIDFDVQDVNIIPEPEGYISNCFTESSKATIFLEGPVCDAYRMEFPDEAANACNIDYQDTCGKTSENIALKGFMYYTSEDPVTGDPVKKVERLDFGEIKVGCSACMDELEYEETEGELDHQNSRYKKLSFKNNFSLHPNPASKIVNLSVKGIEAGQKIVQIIDITGKIVYLDRRVSSSDLTLDIQSLPKGVYIVQVIDRLSKTTNWNELLIKH